MPGKVRDTSYGNVSLVEKVFMVIRLLPIPLAAIYKLITSPLHKYSRRKTWRRVMGDGAFRYMASMLNIRQLQYMTGSSENVYITWAKQNHIEPITEAIGEDSRLFWVTKKRTDKVILYFHGGGFLLPIPDIALPFWKYVTDELRSKKGLDVGFAALEYSLVPTKDFPTQLRQAVQAVNHLIAAGVRPENLVMVGDSAGGNLIIQVLAHILHPLEGVKPVQLNRGRFGGAYMMSPWVTLTGESKSFYENGGSDIIDRPTMTMLGTEVLAGAPDSAKNYLEAKKVPETWFKGVDKIVDYALITGGEAELLRDDIKDFARNFCKHHNKATLIIQQDGIHNDPYYDFLVKERRLSELTPAIVGWVADRFTK